MATPSSGKEQQPMTVTHGVGFAINNKIVSRLAEFPVDINERLMTLCLRLNNNQLATIISVCAPTLDAEEDTKEQFYYELELVLTTVPKEDTKEPFYPEMDLVLTTVLKEDTKEQFYSELDLVLTTVPKENTKEPFYPELDLVLTTVPKEDTKEPFCPELDLVLTTVPKEDTKEQFYSELDLMLTTVLKEDKLILLGDFKARVGRDADCGTTSSARKGLERLTQMASSC